jgi:lipoprotein-anchoring transpeptidase ErfK/SrfK
MRSRFLAGVGVAVGLLTAAGPCLAASDTDPDGIYEHVLGRRPGGGGSGFGFSASPVSRTVVAYAASHRPGTIFISTRERRLYYVLGNGQAIQYGVGVGRIGFTWSGVKTVSAKREWPDWTPPAQMLKRRPDLPRFMRGGEDNPLGARAIYLGSSLYRIHGSNEPETIGQAVSSGCFRLTNEDVIDLYNRVRVGTTVIVQH